jgi:hypothetical protein
VPKRDFFRLPVVSASAEFLVMGYLMRRNILAYKGNFSKSLGRAQLKER